MTTKTITNINTQKDKPHAAILAITHVSCRRLDRFSANFSIKRRYNVFFVCHLCVDVSGN